MSGSGLSWVDENSTTIEGNLTADPKEWASGGMGPKMYKFTVGTGSSFIDVIALEGMAVKASTLKKSDRVRVRGKMVSSKENGYKLELEAASIVSAAPRKKWYRVGRLERYLQWFRIKAGSKEEALELISENNGTGIEEQLEYHSTMDKDKWHVEEEESK